MSTTPSSFRKLCKEGQHTTHTSGCIPGYAQANVLILPKEAADDFADLCERNPVPCPLLGKTILGSASNVDNNKIINDTAFDLRTDLPKYKVFENGKFIEEKTDVLAEWNLESHVGFLIGCSFSFETALAAENLAPKNVVLGTNVSMYLTTKQLNASGIFAKTPYVVSMRPYKLCDLESVRSITRKFRRTHGEPIDWGYDAVLRLGIKDIKNPEFGDACIIEDDEIPVFWACGVTTQVAAMMVGKNIKGKVMAHSPGHMLILDIKDSDIPLL